MTLQNKIGLYTQPHSRFCQLSAMPGLEAEVKEKGLLTVVGRSIFLYNSRHDVALESRCLWQVIKASSYSK